MFGSDWRKPHFPITVNCTTLTEKEKLRLTKTSMNVEEVRKLALKRNKHENSVLVISCNQLLSLMTAFCPRNTSFRSQRLVKTVLFTQAACSAREKRAETLATERCFNARKVSASLLTKDYLDKLVESFNNTYESQK